MCLNIKIDKIKPFKANGFTIRKSVCDFCDTATIKIPAKTVLKSVRANHYIHVEPLTQKLLEGQPVIIEAGYNNENKVRFKGFIRRINYKTPLEIECEGYSYLLVSIKNYCKSYLTTTVRQLLADLVFGTPIKLSDEIPDIVLHKIVFKNFSGIDVLKYLKNKCLLTVYFNGEVLYAGLREMEIKKSVNLLLGWNVIKDNELKYSDNKENANVKIVLQKRELTGHYKKVEHGQKDGNIKVYKVNHLDEKSFPQLAGALKSKLVNSGYEGKVTTFLEPLIEPGMSVIINDNEYSDRKGTFFVESVETQFSTSGGRQVIGVGSSLGTG